MVAGDTAQRILVIGVGNTLLRDDGAGVRVAETLQVGGDEGFEVIDGGTLGLALLPLLEEADAVIVVDASELGKTPGSVAVFEGPAIDRQLSGKRRTVHEVALADLFSAAAIRGRCPRLRALVAIQPGCTEWGLETTQAVSAAIPEACSAIREVAARWRQGVHRAA